jgi:probable rRNA maturation factor
VRVTVSTTLKRLPLQAGRVRELVAFVAAAERRRIGHVEVAVVGASRMATLNERHLRHAGPTDVLSFDLGPGPGGGLCAQIVVCADVASRQARRRGHPAWKELLLYVTHGLLHAMGYDDQTAPAASQMHAREDELLEQFGVGRIYGV